MIEAKGFGMVITATGLGFWHTNYHDKPEISDDRFCFNFDKIKVKLEDIIRVLMLDIYHKQI